MGFYYCAVYRFCSSFRKYTWLGYSSLLKCRDQARLCGLVILVDERYRLQCLSPALLFRSSFRTYQYNDLVKNAFYLVNNMHPELQKNANDIGFDPIQLLSLASLTKTLKSCSTYWLQAMLWSLVSIRVKHPFTASSPLWAQYGQSYMNNYKMLIGLQNWISFFNVRIQGSIVNRSQIGTALPELSPILIF